MSIELINTIGSESGNRGDENSVNQKEVKETNKADINTYRENNFEHKDPHKEVGSNPEFTEIFNDQNPKPLNERTVDGSLDGDTNNLTRREFLKLFGIGTATAAIALQKIGLVNAVELSKNPETVENISRIEHFKPFNRGFAEWQYIQFQYTNEIDERVGITLSMSDLVDIHTGPSPFAGDRIQQLLVMRHNLDTGETVKNIYEGTRSFDEDTLMYTFADNQNNQLAKFTYDSKGDRYLLKINTVEFNSDEIDIGALVLKPQGSLIPVSKDGNFTVAAFEEGIVETNYYANHIEVCKLTTDEIVGVGRHDSQNLDIVGGYPSAEFDMDHSWVHCSGLKADKNRFFITAWESETGGRFKFADVLIINPTTGETLKFLQFNEEDPNFNLDFIPNLVEQETPPGQTKKPEYQMSHGGKVVASIGNKSLFEIKIDGNPGQIINTKGFQSMVEAHGKIESGSVLGYNISPDEGSAIWETTREIYPTFFPMVQK